MERHVICEPVVTTFKVNTTKLELKSLVPACYLVGYVENEKLRKENAETFWDFTQILVL